MFENLAAFTVTSILSIGTFASSFIVPSNKLVSPLPKMNTEKSVLIIPTPYSSTQSEISTTTTVTITPTSTPTLSPTPPSPTPTLIKPDPTETPSPAPTAQPTSSITGPELDNLFSIYSSKYGVEREKLRKIALCESSFNTNASYLGYGGMYQFAEESWMSVRKSMGENSDPSLRFNAEEAVKTAAYKLSQPNGDSAWPSCK